MSTPASPLDPQARAALDAAPCGLLRTDANGTIQWANRTFCAWVEWEESELLAGGRKMQDLLTVGGRIFHQTHWMPLIQMQGSVSEVKLEVVSRSGGKLPMVMNALRREVDGAVVHDLAAFVARDRDKYERELLQSRRQLQELVSQSTRLEAEAKDRALFAEQMVGIVSHDLRNPLSTIQMGALLMARGEATPNQLRVLGRISRAADRAHRLIADLLDFTQARLGKGIAVHRTPIRLHDVIAEAVDELAQAFPGRKLRHERIGEGDCVADGDRLAQLVGNLVANAMTYGRAESPVTVRSAVGAGTCELAVHNDGTPITPELLPTLFEPMVRGATGDSATRSVGLGLFIVHEIAKAHGGTVSVRSTAESGTTFSARFPCAVG